MRKERKEIIKHHFIYCNNMDILEDIKRLYSKQCGEIIDIRDYKDRYNYIMEADLSIQDRACIQELYKMYVKSHHIPYGINWFIDEY